MKLGRGLARAITAIFKPSGSLALLFHLLQQVSRSAQPFGLLGQSFRAGDGIGGIPTRARFNGLLLRGFSHGSGGGGEEFGWGDRVAEAGCWKPAQTGWTHLGQAAHSPALKGLAYRPSRHQCLTGKTAEADCGMSNAIKLTRIPPRGTGQYPQKAKLQKG